MTVLALAFALHLSLIPRQADRSPVRVIDQPVQNIAYVLVRKVWRGPAIATRERLEYDRGKFRQTTLMPDGRAVQVAVYDHNAQRLSYVYMPLAPGKRATLGLESYLYCLALGDPDELRNGPALPPSFRNGVTELSGPVCHALESYRPGPYASPRMIGRDTVAGRTCATYELGAGRETRRIKVWRGWILQSDWPQQGHKEQIDYLRLVDSLPASTFQLPPGYTLDVPGFARAKAPPGIRLHVYHDMHDHPNGRARPARKSGEAP